MYFILLWLCHQSMVHSYVFILLISASEVTLKDIGIIDHYRVHYSWDVLCLAQTGV